MKKHAGRPGAVSNGWSDIGYVGNFENVGWDAYRKEQDNDTGWCYIKIVARSPVENKANYWLSWSGYRFAKTGDFVKMVEHREGLLKLVNHFMGKD